MSDDMSADFGLDVTADDSSDPTSATQINDEIFHGDNGASAEQVTNEIFGNQSGSSDPSGEPGADAVFSDNSTASTEPDAGAIFTDSAPPTESAPTGVNANFSGTEFYAGEATFDSNGDGVADTAIQDHGYQVEYYVDNDGDGQADELTITDANGELISHTQLVDGTSGTWQETAAPNVAAGDMSVSDNVGPSGYVDTAQSGSDTSEPSADSTGPSGPATDYVAGGDLSLTVDGQTYDVGAPTLDFSGDGVADTVAVEQDGNVEYYVDSDQDGVADQIIVLDEANGALINHEVYDPATGTWDNVTEESK